jgi:hypothetical protein
VYRYPRYYNRTVPLRKSTLFIIRFCPILVLTTVLSLSGHADPKNDVKNYQVPTTFQEIAIRILNFSVIIT